VSEQGLLIDDAARGRVEHDFYETPAFQARALLAHVPITGSVLEPCAGLGAITRVLGQCAAISTIVQNEPYQNYRSADFTRDATLPSSWKLFPKVDWVITNPPFKLADQIVPLAYEHARVGVAFLLRLSWFEPTKEREAFLSAFPPDAIVSMPRHKYRPESEHGDSVTTGWFVWMKEPLFGLCNCVVTRAERDALKRLNDFTD
jgi:hypothetical protein